MSAGGVESLVEAVSDGGVDQTRCVTPFVLDFKSAEMAAAALALLPPDLWASEPCRAGRSALRPWSVILGVPDDLCVGGVPADSVLSAIWRLVTSTEAEWNEELQTVFDLRLPDWAPPLPAAMIDGILGVSSGLARLNGLMTVEQCASNLPLPIGCYCLISLQWTCSTKRGGGS